MNLAGRLHLATTDTIVDSLEATSIPIDIIKSYIDVSPANKFVLILDSCFSGAAGESFTLKGSIDDQLQLASRGRGTYIMTASTGIQVAREKEEEDHGIFTKHIIEGIRSGEADIDTDGKINLDELYEYVHRRVLEESPQEPMKWALDVRGEIIIALNIKRRKRKRKIVTLQSKNTFEASFSHFPERILGLLELAYNLWWGWNPEAPGLFKMLGRTEWNLSAHNPVKMLRQIDLEVLDAATKNPDFLMHYDAVMGRFYDEMNISSGWFNTHVADPRSITIAYFSAEYGLHHDLPFYAGGLGFLAGDLLKECSDLGIPLVGIGLMYAKGYLRQKITPDGWQVGDGEILDRVNAPIRQVLDAEGKPLLVKIPAIDPPIYLEVWKVQVGRTALYLIDTSSEANDPLNRCITDRLYIDDPEQRLRQEIVLGIGGIRILKALGIDYTVLHLNEGYSAFAILERIREKMEKGGMSFADSFKQVRKTIVFTTHTPVPANHDLFSFQLMDKYFSSYLDSLKLDRDDLFKLGVDPDNPSGFSMTAFALRSSCYHNAVSHRHADVMPQVWKRLWSEIAEENVPMDYVTNGIHVPSWIDRRLGDVILNYYLGRNWLANHDNPRIWELIDKIPDEVLWKHHMDMKNLLMTRLRARVKKNWLDSTSDPRQAIASGVLFEPAALTLGIAHQFATYKRPTLLFRDVKRLKSILSNDWGPVQIIFAGKAHPNDEEGKHLIQQVYNAAMDPSYCGNIAFVDDYDALLAQYLVHGVDLWVNSPLPPMEASGTSGMKAGLNGIPQLSILDGWWLEGYNDKNGWAFVGAEGPDRDVKDAKAIYDILEEMVVPLYYEVDNEGIPRGWVKTMKETIKRTGPYFSTRRMAKEYVDKFYLKAINAATSRAR